MNPSLTETMTSRKGILSNEFVHVNFIVECKLSILSNRQIAPVSLDLQFRS